MLVLTMVPCLFLDTAPCLMSRMPLARTKRLIAGFSLVELVAVLVILGILSVVIVPSCIKSPATFTSSGFRDQVASALQYAHTVAVASGCPVTFAQAANTFNLDLSASGAACPAATLNGPDGSPFTATAPAGVTLSGAAAITFNADGTASGGTLTVSGGSFTDTVTVIAATGYVQVN